MAALFVPEAVFRALGKASGRRGMTMIEILVAIGVFTTTLLWTIQALMGAVATNRVLMTSITANSAARAQIEELYGVAMDMVEEFGDFSQGVIFYYGSQVATVNSTSGVNGLAIGPNGTTVARVSFNANGTLTYRFVLPEPGFSTRAYIDNVSQGLVEGDLIPYRRGLGEMVMYLDESLMPADPTNPNTNTLTPLWQTLGDNNASNDNERDTDITGPFTTADLRNPGGRGFKRVFVDITVTYYSSERHDREIYSNTRRVLVNGQIENFSL